MEPIGCPETSVWLLNRGRISYPETSVTNYQSTLRNAPEERRPEMTQIYYEVELAGSKFMYSKTVQTVEMESNRCFSNKLLWIIL